MMCVMCHVIYLTCYIQGENEKDGEIHEEDTVQETSKHDGMETDTEYYSDAAPVDDPEDKSPTEMTPEEVAQPNSEEQQPEEKDTMDVPAEQEEEKVEEKPPVDVQAGGKKKKKAKKGKKRNAV